jgi:hypothetical protein
VKPEERAFFATDGLSAHDLGYSIWPVVPFKKVPAISNWPRLAFARASDSREPTRFI